MCDCQVCQYNRDYLKAVEDNNKEFLREHLSIFLITALDAEWYEHKYRELVLNSKGETK